MKKNGFTLIELMVSILILTIVIGTLYSSFRTGLRVADSVDSKIQAYQKAGFILDEISSEIRSAFIAPDNPKIKFVGENDTLDFVSSISSRDEKGYDLRGVRYYLAKDSLKREESLFPYSPSSPIRQDEMERGIGNLRFRYFDGKSWQDSFGSEKILPLAVELTVDLGEESYSTIIELSGGVCLGQE